MTRGRRHIGKAGTTATLALALVAINVPAAAARPAVFDEGGNPAQYLPGSADTSRAERRGGNATNSPREALRSKALTVVAKQERIRSASGMGGEREAAVAPIQTVAPSFSWTDAGIGASVGAGFVALATAAALLVHRRLRPAN